MTDERYKQLMEQVGLPNSNSLLTALQQCANENFQAGAASRDAEIADMKKDATDFHGQVNRLTGWNNNLVSHRDELLLERDQLKQRLAEYKASPTVATCRSMIEAQAVKENEELHNKLAESQAREAQSRKALNDIKMVAESAVKTHGYDKYHVRNRQFAIEALALLHDDTALREWGAKLLRESSMRDGTLEEDAEQLISGEWMP